MPHQTQLDVSANRMASTMIDQETAGRISSSHILHQQSLRQFNETSYSGIRHWNETESPSALGASPRTGLSPHDYGSMPATRLHGTMDYRYCLGSEFAAPQDTILPNSIAQQIIRRQQVSEMLGSPVARSVSNNANDFGSQDIDHGTMSMFQPHGTATRILNDMIRRQQAPHPHAVDALLGGNGGIPSMELLRSYGLSMSTTPASPLRLPAMQGLSGDTLQMNENQAYLRQRWQHAPQPQNPVIDALLGMGNGGVASMEHHRSFGLSTSITPTIPLRLPAVLGRPGDALQMNEHQAYLRFCRQHAPQPQNPVIDALLGMGNGGVASMERYRPYGLSTSATPTIPLRLPAILGQSGDALQMNEHQVYLRQQIEVFEATQDDIDACTRGRNKRIHVGQVGIRCRHCAHIEAWRRQRGTSYFPAALHGLYQAAQNMSTNHIQCGLCTEMPESVKTRFVELWPTKNNMSSVGRRYWEEKARDLGLVDTEDAGISFQPNADA